MPRLYLVRHGQAAASFGEHADPGLDDLGRRQAAATAARLAPLGPLALLSSPLARAVETAQPLLVHWPQRLRIDVRIAEIPSATDDLIGRAEWLGRIMAGRWRDHAAPLQAWASSVVTCLTELPTDTVIFSHFIAINVAVGAATNDDRVVTFRPDNASVTIIDVAGKSLRLIEPGDAAETRVN